jgi:hypothetical protein
MKTILAFAVGGAALFAAASANAQDCVGGYMMLKDQIPIRCDAGFGGEQIGIAPVQPLPEETISAGLGSGGGNANEIPVYSGPEPVYTGSITPSAAEPTGLGSGGGNADEIPSATNRMDDSCWIETANSGVTLPRACN